MRRQRRGSIGRAPG